MITKYRFIFCAASIFLSLTLICGTGIKRAHEKKLKLTNQKYYYQKNQLLVLNREKEEKIEISLKQLEDIKNINKIKDDVYSIEEFNNFVKKMENIRKKYRGVNKISYELLDRENRATINLSYMESYNNIKEFLYEVEKTFFFLDINYLNMEKDNNRVKGNLSIQVFFRGNDDEG